MAVIIGEVVTEALGARSPEASSPGPDALDMEDVVRRAAEQVLEILRREWDL